MGRDIRTGSLEVHIMSTDTYVYDTAESESNAQQRESEMRLEFPWEVAPLNEWVIFGMYHYHLHGDRCLFVSMTKNGRCITEEGSDDGDLWHRLREKALVEEVG